MVKKSLVLFLVAVGMLLGSSVAFGEEISLDKNPEYLGDFAPQKIYEIQKVAGKFEIVSSEDALSSKNGKTELVAIGTDELDTDFFVFRLTCEGNQDECEKTFEEGILNFQE